MLVKQKRKKQGIHEKEIDFLTENTLHLESKQLPTKITTGNIHISSVYCLVAKFCPALL